MLLQNAWCMVTLFFTVKQRTMKRTEPSNPSAMTEQQTSVTTQCQFEQKLKTAVKDMTSDNGRKYKVVQTSTSHAMHRQKVRIKRFPFVLLGGSHN